MRILSIFGYLCYVSAITYCALSRKGFSFHHHIMSIQLPFTLRSKRSSLHPGVAKPVYCTTFLLCESEMKSPFGVVFHGVSSSYERAKMKQRDLLAFMIGIGFHWCRHSGVVFLFCGYFGLALILVASR